MADFPGRKVFAPKGPARKANPKKPPKLKVQVGPTVPPYGSRLKGAGKPKGRST